MPSPTDENKSRESAWAKPVDRMQVTGVPAGAVNLNVDGRRPVGPLQGFGQMWQKTYRVRLAGADVTPVQLIKTWKDNFASFWPKGNQFYKPLTGIQPGDVAVLNLAGPGGMTAPGGLPIISTGVMVIYADDTSFCFMTPQGHMFAGIITFSAMEETGSTVAQVQALIRANDPLYELTFRLGVGHKMEDEFWRQTLEALASYFGVQTAVQKQVTLVDPRMQWSEAKNIWLNAGIRTALNTPLALARKLFENRRMKDEG